MSNESSQLLPPNGRLISAGMAAAAAIGLLINHFMIGHQNVGKLMILALGPIAFFIGIGGIVEPKILWSVGKYGKQLPVIYKLIGGALGALGLGVTLLLLLFVYRLGPPEPKPATSPRLPQRAAATSNSNSKSNQPIPASKPERHVAPQEVMNLTYDRPNKRWVQMDAEALKGVRRELAEGVTTLHYAEGEHALLKVLWPDILEVGDRFTVEVQGVNSIELVDLEGPNAYAATSIPQNDTLVVVEMRREQDKISFICNGQSQKTLYASAALRGEDAKPLLFAASLRAGFTVKRGEQASFRNAKIVKP